MAKKLGEGDVLELESELIARHGEYLTNWVNSARKFDDAALERFHALHDATTSFVSAIRLMVASDPGAAAARYRQTIADP